MDAYGRSSSRAGKFAPTGIVAPETLPFKVNKSSDFKLMGAASILNSIFGVEKVSKAPRSSFFSKAPSKTTPGVYKKTRYKLGPCPQTSNWVIVFLLLIVLQGIKGYRLEQVRGTGLALGGLQHLTTHLQLRIPRCSQVSRTGEQHRNSLAGTTARWLMSFKRHLC